MKKNMKENVRVNITVDKDFYMLLEEAAKRDYMLVGTWVRRYLKKNLINQCEK